MRLREGAMRVYPFVAFPCKSTFYHKILYDSHVDIRPLHGFTFPPLLIHLCQQLASIGHTRLPPRSGLACWPLLQPSPNKSYEVCRQGPLLSQHSISHRNIVTQASRLADPKRQQEFPNVVTVRRAAKATATLFGLLQILLYSPLSL